MLNPRTNRRSMTRLARFGSLGVLVSASLVVAALHVGPVSASHFVESIGNVVEQEQPAEPSSERRAAIAAAVAAAVEAAAASRSAESTGNAVEQEQPAFQIELSSEQRAAIAAAVAAAVEAAAASRSAESTGNAVEQEQPAEPSSEQIAELVARAAALQEQLQAVLDEMQVLLGDSDRSAGGSNSNEPFRIGDGIRSPAKIVNVNPVYPPEAREARVQGVVILEATISRTGEVSDVEVMRSVPLLDEAAVAAVRQWRYEPTLVDGEPVSILMTVTMNFQLRDDEARP